MNEQVAIIGVGCLPARGTSTDVSYREMTYEAAIKAYSEAGVDPRELDTFLTASEDYNEGVSIFDEYTPDQLGAVLKPVHTITGDGLMALAAGWLQIATGQFRTAVVEAHSKASNVLTPEDIEEFALDPIFFRNLRLEPSFLAAMDMRRYLHDVGEEACAVAGVPVQNRRHAMTNEVACYGARITEEDVLESDTVACPLTKEMVARPADGAIVMVLANRDVVEATGADPVWIDGLSFFTAEPSPDTWPWGRASYASLAAKKAYKMAGIRSPVNEIDIAEVDDRFAHKALVHLEELGLAPRGAAGGMWNDGAFSCQGDLPVNLSGGHMGIGTMHEATCLYQLREAVLQLRGQAGTRQVEDASRAVVQSWRGLPTQTGATVVLSAD